MENKETLVKSATTFKELFEVIDEIAPISGTYGPFSRDEMKRIVTKYRLAKTVQDEKKSQVTRTHGIRSKVVSLEKNLVDTNTMYNLLKTGGKPFQQILSSPDHSGWKLHIYGENHIDSFNIGKNLHSVLDKYGVAYKVHTKMFHDRVKGGKQEGKTATLYLPISIFVNGNVTRLINEIKEILTRIQYEKGGEIYGDKQITPSIHYRYEANVPMPVSGFTPNKAYRNTFYRHNDGKYNISGNPDIIQICLDGASDMNEIAKVASKNT